MTTDLMKLMGYIDSLQSVPTPEPVVEVEETNVHPLLQAMQELKEEGIVEAKESIKDQIEKAIIMDGGNLSDYFIRSSTIDKIGYSIKQIFGRSPDVGDPGYDIDYVGHGVGKPALWFYPASYYLKQDKAFAQDYPYVWLVKLKPNAWLQPVNKFTKSKQDAPEGKERVGILKNKLVPAAIFFKPAFEVVDKFVDFSKQHKRHGEVKGPQVDEEIAYHGTVDDINEFHPLTHFGTEKAAKDRMEYKKIKDGKIYKVDLDIKNPLTIKDFPGIHYDRQYAFELRDKGLISQKEMEAITFIQDKQELRKALLNKLSELGIDGFVYKNKYEDKGNISYVIVDPSQVKVLSVEPATEEVAEASPDTLEGSFTPDLVESKTWLCEKLAQGLKGKNAGTIYVLGSWYGNMGIFLQQAGVKFDKLVLVEPDEEALMRSKELLDTLNDDGKLILIHQNAEDVVYEKPGVVINTSCNETGPVFLTKLPDNMLCLLQARNNVDNVLIETDSLEEFTELFPLSKTYYTGEKELTDPETEYTRYMIIGRSGKKLDETISTGQGGGSAGVGGGQMVGGPTTYEDEYGMFKSKGPRRIMSMTEALDSSYEYRGSKQNPGNVFYFDTEDGQEYKVEFNNTYSDQVEVSFAVRGQGDEHKTGITGTGNSRKVFGTVIKIVKDYINKANPEILSFSANSQEPSRVRLYKMLASQANKELPNYNFADAFSGGGFTTYYLTRDDAKIPATTKVKAKAGKALDKVFENSITLNKLYGDNKPHRDDTIWDYGTMIWDNEYPIETINPNKLNLYLQSQYRIEHYEELFDMMDEEQQEIVEKYVNDPNLSDKIIVLDNGYIVDGNHRALAAVIANKPIKYIDIGEEDESS